MASRRIDLAKIGFKKTHNEHTKVLEKIKKVKNFRKLENKKRSYREEEKKIVNE